MPPIHRLSNGTYEVAISDVGSGQSSCRGLALNRWANDPVADDLGYFFYLRDLDTGRVWSLGHQPVCRSNAGYRVTMSGDRFTVDREDEGIEARMEVTLAVGVDLEMRRLTLRNLSRWLRRIELTSYLEVVLFPGTADAAHAAFAKLFLQTELAPAYQALLARRRPCGDECWPWLVHALVGGHLLQWETDRLRFLGRGGTPGRPAALLGAAPLSGTVGNVLDAVFSLRTVVELAPGATVEPVFLLGVAAERQAALDLIGEWRGVQSDCSVAAAVQAEPVPKFDKRPTASVSEPAVDDGLRFFNGYGGFSDDGSEYVIRLPWQGEGLRRPPLPWVNVVANERCGFLVSESGAGSTWARNSQANRLTPWFNDPVSDPHGEAWYIRDETAGRYWSPLPGPAPLAGATYEVRHGFGYSCFTCEAADLSQETTLFVPPEDPLRILWLRLTHCGVAPRRLSLFAFQRLVLGSLPQAPSPIVTGYDADWDLLWARNPKGGEFRDGVVFACAVVHGAAVSQRAFSCDRLAFIGRHGSLSAPAGLQPGTRLNGIAGSGLDPCFAQQVEITLACHQSVECAFLLGEGFSQEEATALCARYRSPGAVAQALARVRAKWRSIVSAVQVQTPEPALDLMLNGWLVYQNLCCRLWARTALYQSSGAYGYRDQLQDAAALVMVRPDLTRAQILLHARHQFLEGDVLHWWHPLPMERGVRTRFSDDRLWLPFVTAHYIHVTGDQGVLDEQLPFLTAPQLQPGEDEAYLRPLVTRQHADLYTHCCRALDCSLTRGAHGLPLMGTGDWNDGMNRVGRAGRGESVWLGFFLYAILENFLPLCQGRGDWDRTRRYASFRVALGQALNDQGWDGAWYRRAFYDDGTALGSATDSECRIDALAQAWAVISRAAPAERAKRAMEAVEQQLIAEDDGIIRLLTPPFVDTPRDPGYIKGYVAGVRENGGQYTHAACWVVQAIAELGGNNRAAPLLTMLSPISHALEPPAVQRYKVEPYVVAADVYGAPPHVGRGGWTWYTGSAGWMFRVALESVLGLQIENGDTLLLQPCVPDNWPAYQIRYRHPEGGTVFHIEVRNPAGRAKRVVTVEVDGRDIKLSGEAARIPLFRDGGMHSVLITLG